MIKAVIFDFFGVLGQRGFASFRKTYFPDEPEKNKQVKKLQDQLGLGLLSYDGFIDSLVELSGKDRETILKYTEKYQPNSLLLDYIRRDLKPKYKLGIISNAGADWVLKILGSSNMKLFDSVILSYKVGFIKPDAEIYKISIKELGVKAEESVFVDDILTYCKGAEAAGMNAIWYKDFPGFKKELEATLAAADN